jgi:hypothetical protein
VPLTPSVLLLPPLVLLMMLMLMLLLKMIILTMLLPMMMTMKMVDIPQGMQPRRTVLSRHVPSTNRCLVRANRCLVRATMSRHWLDALDVCRWSQQTLCILSSRP